MAHQILLEEQLELENQYEIRCAEDRQLEKGFRKEFAEVDDTFYEYIVKAFRKRPKHPEQSKPSHAAKEELELAGKSGSTIYNPYIEKSSSECRELHEKALLYEHLVELDNDPERGEQPGYDESVWLRMCQARRRKIGKELEIKTAALRQAELTAFIQNCVNDLEKLRSQRELVDNQLAELADDYHRSQTDLEVQLLIQQGQVEIEAGQNGELVHNYSDALLVKRDQVEQLNTRIVALGEIKVAQLVKNKELKKRRNLLEWELREKLMQYEDLKDKSRSIKNFNITRDAQKYLTEDDYDKYINSQILDTERVINLSKKNHIKVMEQKRERLEQFLVQKQAKLKRMNQEARIQLEELNIDVHEIGFVHEQSLVTDLSIHCLIIETRLVGVDQDLDDFAPPRTWIEALNKKWILSVTIIKVGGVCACTSESLEEGFVCTHDLKASVAKSRNTATNVLNLQNLAEKQSQRIAELRLEVDRLRESSSVSLNNI